MVAGLTVNQVASASGGSTPSIPTFSYLCIMYYIVQQNLFREVNFDILINLFNKWKIEYEIIDWIPFQEEITIHTERKDIICFGGVSLTKVAKKYGWEPGVFYNENHDMEVYFHHYKEHMLNSDGFFIQSQDELPAPLPEAFFARPADDTKLFSGGLFSRKGWNDTMKAYLSIKKGLEHDVKIFVAPDKDYIAKEIRCWIVDGRVITLSQYKLGILVIQKNYDHDEEAFGFAQRMADTYSPSRAYVLDICLYQGEWKVVEINCINSAGFYDANMNKLLNALEAMSFVWEPEQDALMRTRLGQEQLLKWTTTYNKEDLEMW